MSAVGYEHDLQVVRSLCLALPEVTEGEAWGHPIFRAGKKMFAGFGAEDGVPTLGLKVGLDRQGELLEDTRFFRTPHAAHQGWVSLHLDARTDWREVGMLIREAYRQVALKRMLDELEAAPEGGGV